MLVITELWRTQNKHQKTSKEFIASESIIIKKGPRKGQKRFPNDRAAGVGIMLSPRIQAKVHSFGPEGEWVYWVRLKGPVCDLLLWRSICRTEVVSHRTKTKLSKTFVKFSLTSLRVIVSVS